MKDFFIPPSPIPALNATRLDQMIATALSVPQEQRKTKISGIFYHFIKSFFIRSNNLHAGLAVMATLMIVSAVTLLMPTSMSSMETNMDNSLSELHEMLLYETIDAAI